MCYAQTDLIYKKIRKWTIASKLHDYFAHFEETRTLNVNSDQVDSQSQPRKIRSPVSILSCFPQATSDLLDRASCSIRLYI